MSPVPLYHQVATSIRTAVDTKLLAEGAPVGPEHRLAQNFRVSVPTIRKAMDLLEEEGIVVRKRGVGTFVASSFRKQPLTVTYLGNDELLGAESASLVKVMADTPIQEAFGLGEDAHVWRVRRRQMLKNRPVALLDNFHLDEPSARRAERLLRVETPVLPTSHQEKMRLARHQITAELADQALSLLLEVPQQTPVLVMACTAFGWNDKPIAFSKHFFLASEYRFEATF
ncbi:GntR family transcriptional regulator [Arthrobacter sp. C152]